MSYASFLATKERRVGTIGEEVAESDLHPSLFPFQRAVTRWAIAKGRCAVFLDTGLGKTRIQLEWAKHSGETVLLVTPLSVARQTIREAAAIDMDAVYVRRQADVTGPGLWVTNYESDHHFDPSAFDAVVWDESSIVKHSDSKTRQRLCRDWAIVPRRLACTATPAPNDVAELTNHAELLGVMPRAEMLAAYFVHDDSGWRLKGHAVEPMWRWVSSWAMSARTPADLGFPDDRYHLPPLNIHEESVPVQIEQPGQLFATDLGGVGGRARVRQTTLDARVERTMEVLNAHRFREAPGVHAPVATGERRAHPPVQTGAGAGEECSPAQEVCRGRGVQGSGQSEGAGVQRANPDATGESGSEVQGGPDRPRIDDERRVCDLPSESAGGSGSQDACGSRSPDGNGQGGAVPVVQSGAGASPRRPARGHGDVRLSHGIEEPWIVWCGLNDEQDKLTRALGDRAISIYGALSPEEKERRLTRWLDGERPILVTKPSVCGVGLNLQRAHRMAFLGMGDSYEAYYQAIRRCYRFGQTEPVDVHIVVSELESQIVANVRRKEAQDRSRISHLVRYSREELASAS